MDTVEPGIWQDTWKCRKWGIHPLGREIWQGKLKIMENEKHTLEDLKNYEITEKREKWEMHTVGPAIMREVLKITENENNTL